MRVIGVTGGIASGKTAVSQLLKRWGFPVIDADQVARDVVAPGTPGIDAVHRAFGPKVMDRTGHLNRSALRALIARSEEARQTLNGILHPLIRERIGVLLTCLEEQHESVAFVEAALLVETGGYRAYDGLLLVTADLETRLARLAARDGMVRDDALALMERQCSDDEKRLVADAEVRNDGTLKDLEARLRLALETMKISLPRL